MARTGVDASNPSGRETELLKSFDLPGADISTIPTINPDPITQRFQKLAVNMLVGCRPPKDYCKEIVK
jgi:hypothetical protein